ncbi:MAG: hypothetical protein HQL32_02805 [Planctomycetes bacterium]|nr:hypothetical protein [Planctomycetota bacterium]
MNILRKLSMVAIGCSFMATMSTSILAENLVIINEKLENTPKGWAKQAEFSLNIDGGVQIILNQAKWSGVSMNYANYGKKNPLVTDLGKYSHLQLTLTIDPSSSKTNPLAVTLGDTSNAKSLAVNLGKHYGKALPKGEKVTVDIPLNAFVDGEKALDRSKIWELIIGAFSGNEVKDLKLILHSVQFTAE